MQIRTVTYEVEFQRSLEGEMTIVLISDLHLGEVASERRLGRIVAQINGLNPDIVAIAGDIFNDDFHALRDPEGAAALLRGINAPLGVFACLGNHDTGPTIGLMKEFLVESNIQLLNDEHAIVDNRLVVIGRLDALPPWTGDGFGDMRRRDFVYVMEDVKADLAYQGLPLDLPVVVIDHNPANIGEYGSNVDLALFGHTHSGALFPISLVTRAMFVIDRGHFRQDSQSPHIIVTQGVHVWSIPLRVGTRNEIVVVNVK
ncbi:MAG: metallophosphoesterase [Defluviitaleaceae bacterium]|nr:metallophosphoesterase [Defluviitaleaceae bacterium]